MIIWTRSNLGVHQYIHQLVWRYIRDTVILHSLNHLWFSVLLRGICLHTTIHATYNVKLGLMIPAPLGSPPILVQYPGSFTESFLSHTCCDSSHAHLMQQPHGLDVFPYRFMFPHPPPKQLFCWFVSLKTPKLKKQVSQWSISSYEIKK